MSNRQQRLAELFEQASQLPPAERRQFIDQHCGDDPPLATELKALLEHADEDTIGLQEQLGSQVAESAAALEDLAGNTVGPYRLLRRIGRGGMGTVYLAEEIDGELDRKLALKLVEHAHLSPYRQERLREEARLLARLSHPNIAHVYQAGSISGGLSYIAMEYIDGLPIDQWCEQHAASPEQRLELVASICKAVQYAHQAQIAHRDIKPANILVTNDGQPKLVDFGIAKLLGDDQADNTATALELRAMTLEFASPEQISGQPVGTPSDIYSLGVLLYYLLTGQTPLQLQDLKLAERIEAVLQQAPAAPSVATGQRHLRGELDWLVMQCLEKEPQRRYPTAAALADDIQRYLAGEPIAAAPPSRRYRLGKFISRHRLPVAAAGIAIAALMAGVIGIALGLNEANAQRQAAEAAEQQARQRAQELQLVADFQAAQLRAIDPAGMGVNLRQALLDRYRQQLQEGASRPELPAPASIEQALNLIGFTDLTLELLDANLFAAAAETIEQDFTDLPLVQARLLQSMGNTMRELGLLEAGEPILQQALSLRETHLGDSHPDTLETVHSLALHIQLLGRLDDAEPLARRSLDQRRQVLGADHPHTLESKHQWALLIAAQGEFESSIEYYEKALEGRRKVLGKTHIETLATQNSLGFMYYETGQYERALAMHENTLSQRKDALGPRHPHVVISLTNLGMTHQAMGQLDTASEYYAEALTLARDVLGGEHHETLTALTNMGGIHLLQEEPEAAHAYLAQALELRRATLGDTHPDTVGAMTNLAVVLRSLGELERAYDLGESAVQNIRQVLPEGHWLIGIHLGFHAETLLALGHYEQALQGAEEAVPLLSAVLGEDHERTLGIVEIAEAAGRHLAR